MVHRSRARSSSLFLMELILAILFFSVASAVCVEFFVKSHLLSQDSDALTHAVNECSGAAEIICTSDSLKAGVDLLRLQYPEGGYPDLQETEDEGDITVCLYYDESFLPCSRKSAAYVMNIYLTEKEQMIEAVIEMNKDSVADGQDASVYRLETKHHIAGRTDFDER